MSKGGSAVGQDDYAATSDTCLALSGVAGWPGPRAGTSGPTGIMTRAEADDEFVRPLHQVKPPGDRSRQRVLAVRSPLSRPRVRVRLPAVASECSAATGSVILIAIFAASAVLNYTFGLALAWLLVPAEFGIVSAVQTVLMLSAGLLAAGLPLALTRRVAETRGDHEAAKPEFRTVFVTNAGLGLLLGTAFLAAQLSGLQLVPTHSLFLDLAVAAEMPVLAVNSALVGAAAGSRRFGGMGAMQGGEILVKCIASVFLLIVLHSGPAGVALGFLIGTLGSVLIGVRADKGLLPGRGPLARLSFLAASGWIWFASASMIFLITADLLGLEMIGRAAGVNAAVLAGYQACGLLARASFYVCAALSSAVFPFIARSKTVQEKHHWFMAAARWVPLGIIPIQVGLFLAPGPVLRLFLPHQYSGAQTLLRVLAAGTLGALITNMLMEAMCAIGYGRQVGRRMSIAVVIDVIGLVVLVPGHGALGAAYSYLIASYVGVALLVPLYLKALQVRLPAPRRLAAYAAGLAPTAVVFALADRAPTPADWALIVTGACLFLFPARRMRLITDADLTVLQALRARLKVRSARGTDSDSQPGWPANAWERPGHRLLRGSQVQISVVRPNELGPDEIAAWHSMQRMTGSLANPFMCPEFAVAVGHFRADARVAVLTDGPRVVGFFPFEGRRLGVGVPVGGGLSNRHGLIHAPAIAWDARELLRACRLSVWQFDNLAEGQRPFERYAVARVPSALIDLTDGFASYQEKLRAKSARLCGNIGRNTSKLARDAGELRYVVDSRDITGLRTLMGWKSDQCRRNGWFDAFDRPWMVDVADYLFNTRSDGFGGLLSLLYAGEIPVAAQFGLRFGNLFAGWFTAYDTCFGKYSPGLIQFMRMAEELAAIGVHIIDLGATRGSYKERLKSHDVLVSQGMVVMRPLAASAHRTRRALAGWADRQIRQHPPLFRAADQVLRHYGRIA